MTRGPGSSIPLAALGLLLAVTAGPISAQDLWSGLANETPMGQNSTGGTWEADFFARVARDAGAGTGTPSALTGGHTTTTRSGTSTQGTPGSVPPTEHGQAQPWSASRGGPAVTSRAGWSIRGRPVRSVHGGTLLAFDASTRSVSVLHRAAGSGTPYALAYGPLDTAGIDLSMGRNVGRGETLGKALQDTLVIRLLENRSDRWVASSRPFPVPGVTFPQGTDPATSRVDF